MSHDCELYHDFMRGHAEKQKFHDAAREFFKKYGFMESGQYVISTRLRATMGPGMRERFAGQLMKYDTSDGLSMFKKNSKMQKAWEEEVVAKADMEAIDWCRLWWFPYIRKGSYALWASGDDVYGYLKETNGDVKLPDGAAEIKLSEYYAAIEASEGKND